ncbi:MAG: hypothetical protein A2Z72_05630 [Omnitrophica bacterium RBG_13_46_9]|nr:MAG: hypothetical protein A2Z72_05630 [Omnitrophica bacterium RBG_13_46_9]
MAGLGLFFSSVLAIANQKLKVKEDPRVEEIENLLPGVNCGACGFANCHQYAESLVKGDCPPDRCKAGGQKVSQRLAEILGVSVGKSVKEAAIIHCGANAFVRKKKAVYVGIKTCLAAHNTFGGEIHCVYGCLGYGDCAKACFFGAVTMVNGLPKIDNDKCAACGKCAFACPRGLIAVEKMDSEKFIYVACNSLNKGPETRKICPVGCIGCGLCQKLTRGIFYVENNLARVQYGKIKDIQNPEEVISKCPTKCILKVV